VPLGFAQDKLAGKDDQSDIAGFKTTS